MLTRHFLIVFVAADMLGRPPVAEPSDPPDTSALTMESGTPLGVQVRLRARIAKPVAGHEYRLMCQYRIHTRKGESGPILGDSSQPTGRAFDLGALEEDAQGGRDLAVERDVNRQDLSGMTNLPAGPFVLRVEPHIYDTTAGKFVTPSRPDAAILFLGADPKGHVYSVETFADWFWHEFGGEQPARAAIRLVEGIDAWDLPEIDSDLVRGYERVLADPKRSDRTLAIAITAVPTNRVLGKNLLAVRLRDIAADPNSDPAVRDAARKKLAEAGSDEKQ